MEYFLLIILCLSLLLMLVVVVPFVISLVVYIFNKIKNYRTALKFDASKAIKNINDAPIKKSTTYTKSRYDRIITYKDN